jgi:hypothetical protein
MAAGLGFKTFNTGDVLSAGDTNGYLMQGVLVFADAAARTAAITSPQEGQTSYLKDTDVIQVYSGSAWVTKSGGSPLTTKGDVYTYSTTDARLAVGANDTILTADSTTATGLKWAAAGGSDWTLIATGTLPSASTLTVSSIPAYNTIRATFMRATTTGAFTDITFRMNNLSTGIYNTSRTGYSSNTNFNTDSSATATEAYFFKNLKGSGMTNGSVTLEIANCKNTSYGKTWSSTGNQIDEASLVIGNGFIDSLAVVDRLDFTGSFNGSGTYYIWGI